MSSITLPDFIFLNHRYRLLQRILFAVLLLGWALYFSWMAFVSEGVLEHGDGIAHYQAAHYAPQKPELYLDHWSKPLFTLLASPFAQLGFPGMILFNVLLFVITAALLFAWAEKRNVYWAWLTPLLMLASVVYYDMVNAGMTEILFAGLAVATVYLFLQKKYMAGAILFSFSIFSRPEGMLILPVFAVFLATEKQWKMLPFLATGFVLYAIVGLFVFGDFLWYIHQNPYPPGTSIYGNGKWHFFVLHAPLIWGYVPLAGFIGGLLFLLISLFGKNRREALRHLLLLVVPILVVLGVHSYIWWKGIQGSAGLLRVMATVAPLALFPGFLMLEAVQQKIQAWFGPRFMWALFVGSGFLLAWYLYSGNWRLGLLPISETPYQKTLSEASIWMKNEAKPAKIYYMDPYFAYKTNLNPFDSQKLVRLYALDRIDPLASIKPDEYIVWDALLSPLEGRMPKEYLADSRLEIIHTFKPKPEVITFYGEPYEVIVARKR
jgi:hypothetical protein